MVVSIFTSIQVQDDVQINLFRPIYYLGCKTNFTGAIKAAIDEVDPSGGRVCDLFAGTGAVAAALGSEREVTTVDVQEYSRVLCSAVLAPADLALDVVERINGAVASSEIRRQIQWCLAPLIELEERSIDSALTGDTHALIELLESPPLAALDRAKSGGTDGRFREAADVVIGRLEGSGLWRSADTTVSRHFGGAYFSFRQSAALDAMLSIAEQVDEGLRDTLKAVALSVASQLVNTVGKQFAQPLRPRNKSGAVKANLARVVQRDRSLDALEAHRTWLSRYGVLRRAIGTPRSLRQDYLETLDDQSESCSVVYADPPYTRDHYSRFYHVLETMCLRDEPTIARVMKGGELAVSRGLYREDRHQSPFCIRSSAPEAFAKLFESAKRKNVPLVLSYSPHEAGDGTHPRVVSINQIVELARAYYGRVELSMIDGSTHNQLNSSALKLKTREHAETILTCYC